MAKQARDPITRPTMEKSLFKFIWRYSAPQQLTILLITVIAYPVTYVLLELPKLIVNDAIQGENFPREVYGFEFDQVSYLVVLCLAFLGLVILSNGIKLALNVYKGGSASACCAGCDSSSSSASCASACRISRRSAQARSSR